MPDVGSLFIKIESDAGTAADNLGKLATKLGSIKKNSDVDLGNVQQQIANLVNSVKGGEKAASALGTLFNSISTYYKTFKGVTDKFKLNTQPIEQIKSAVDGGIKIGNAGSQLNQLRLALEGNWNMEGAQAASAALESIGPRLNSIDGENLKATATGVKQLAEALDEFAKATEAVKSAVGGDTSIPLTSKAQFESLGADNAAGMASGIEDGKAAVAEAARDMTQTAIETVAETQESHSPAKKSKAKGNDFGEGYIQGIREKIEKVAEIAAEMTRTAISYATNENKSELGTTIGDTLQGLISGALEKMDVSEAFRTKMNSVASELSGFIKAAMSSATGEFDTLGNIAAEAVSTAFFLTLENAIEDGSIVMSNTISTDSDKLLPDTNEANVSLQETETVIQNANEAQSDFLSTSEQITEQTQMTNEELEEAMRISQQMNAETGQLSQDWINGESEIREATSATEDFVGELEELQNVSSSVDAYNPAIEFAREWNAAKPGQNNSFATEAKEDIEYIDQLIDKSSKIDLLNMRIDALRDKLYEGASSGRMTGDQIANTISQIQGMQEEVENLTATTTGLTGAWNSFKGGLSKLFPTLSQLLGRFKQIAKYRALRYVLRSITSGFSEGVKNVYYYSKAIGSDFSTSMDNAASSLEQMKNSIGAAVAPVIQALIPYLQTVVSWFISLINYVNQFFALLNGQNTWTRALETQATAYDDNAKAAKNASNAAKDLLADWDELNIIQSSSSGSTGSGSGSDVDYSSMFEEVNEFSEDIKDAISFLEEHLGGLKGLLTTLGALILGWKFSKAFTGILSKIGKLVAGGALMYLGIEFAFGSGFEAGQKGYFDTGDLLGAIGGTIATAIGGSMITSALGLGGGVGLAIGLTVGIVATLLGWIKGQQDAADAIKWGNLHLTAEEVERYVKEQFTFDITAEISALHTNVTDMEAAKEEADAKITEFEGKLKEAKVNLKLGCDADPEGTTVKDAVKAAQDAIGSVQSLIDQTEEGIEIGLKYLPYKNNSGEDVSDDILAQIKVADKPVRDYMRELGEALAKAMYEGEEAGWANGTDEAAIKLMEEQQAILAKAKQYQQEMELQSKIDVSTEGVVKDGVLDRESAIAALEYQQQLIEDYKKEALAEATAERNNLYYIAGLAKAASEVEKEKGNFEKAEELMNSYTALMEKANERYAQATQAADDKLKESKERIAKDWGELLQTVYGRDINQEIMEGTSPLMDWMGGLYQVPTSFAENLKNAEDKGNFIASWLLAYIKDIDNNGIIGSAINEFGMNIWDLLTEGARKNLFMNTADILGSSSEAAEALMKAFGLTQEDIKEYIDNYAQYDYEIDTNGWDPFEFMKFNAPDTVYAEAEMALTINGVETLIPARTFDELERQVEEAMKDHQLTAEERSNISSMFGEYGDAMLEGMLNYLNIELDENGWDNYQSDRGSIKDLADAVIASGMPMNLGGRVENHTKTSEYSNGLNENGSVVKTESANPEQDANSIRTGTQTLASTLGSILTLVEKLNNKEWVINVNPSSDWGFHNQRSNNARQRVTG